jgi:predicted RNase H-like nuclease (RuvC/YqgF family)
MLMKLKELVSEEKKEQKDREDYVRGKFRVEASLPFTLDNFEMLHQEATKLGEDNDSLKAKVAALTATNFDLQSRL